MWVQRRGGWLLARPQSGRAGPTQMCPKGSSLPAEPSKCTFLGEGKKMKARAFVVSVNQSEMPYLLRVSASLPCSTALAMVFLLFSVEGLVDNRLFST